MKARRQEAFTLIELMVSLVVAGILMAALVGLSGTVQRSFGRSKDIIELQGNLRIAMHGLVEDIGRAAYMYSPDPDRNVDSRTQGFLPADAGASVGFDLGNGMFTLRGNYVSSRDYLWNLDDSNIYCRNGMRYDANCCDPFGLGVEPFQIPFGDGPGFDQVFCPGELVRVDIGNGQFSYHIVNSATKPTVTLAPAPVRTDQVQGEFRWISPVTTVQYQMINDPLYARPYTGAVPAVDRWVLQRISTDCRGVQTADVADFLLPPAAAAPGFVIAPYNITAIAGPVTQICLPDFDFAVDAVPTPITAATPIQPASLRAIAVILRGRTEMEDPALTVAHPDHSVDLDGNPANGMAHVRAERTMIQLRNLGITYCVN